MSMNVPLRTLITNLDVISGLNPGDKIYMKKDGTIDSVKILTASKIYPSDFWEFVDNLYATISQKRQAINRWWIDESRVITWNYLESNIQLAIDYLGMGKKDFNKELLSKLENSKNGIDNLIKTYSDDAGFVSKLKTLKIIIDSELIKHNHKSS